MNSQKVISSISPTGTPANETVSSLQQQFNIKKYSYQKAFQPKLSIGASDDPLEKEADDMADKVMRIPMPDPINFSSSKNTVNRKCAECEEEEKLHRKESNSDSTSVVPLIVHDVINSSGGKFLDADIRAYMEPRFNYDFGNVKIHDNDLAAKSAGSINALAYTSGNNVVFNSGQYNTNSDSGKRLLAHELTHVVQQEGVFKKTSGKSQSLENNSTPTIINRSPARSDTEEMHDDLVEEFRQENGFPPHGIDPGSGEPIGPSNAEIRFGGLLEKWLASKQPPSNQSATPSAPSSTTPSTPPASVPGVPAPVSAPTILSHGRVAAAACNTVANPEQCLHQIYVTDTLPKVIANIRNVNSPYSSAISAMYGSALSAAQALTTWPTQPTPAHRWGTSVTASGVPGAVTFGATTHNFTSFDIILQQFPGGANGLALSIGGPTAAIMLNEASIDAQMSDLEAIEQTMVHEAIHVLSSVVTANNAARTTGTPAIDPNLDEASYAQLLTRLETAVTPFVRDIRTRVSSQVSEASDISLTAKSFMSETIARTEAGIYVKQRAGQAFTAADLQVPLGSFFHAPDYWSPDAPAGYITSNQAAIDASVGPIIIQMGELYLTLRP